MENLIKPVITVFSEQQKKKIHSSVLHLLEKTGIIVKEPEMLLMVSGMTEMAQRTNDLLNSYQPSLLLKK